MTLKEAFAKELEQGYRFGLLKITECRLCQERGYCRASVCFKCKHLVETDMVDVWEIANPQNRWPYKWAETEPVPEPQTKKQFVGDQLSLFQGFSKQTQKRRRGA